MNLLLIDTSCSAGFLSLGPQLLRLFPLGPGQSHRIAPLLAEALAEQGLSVQELEGIAVGSGPGSFTGLRVAAALAQGFRLGIGLPVHGFRSLKAYPSPHEGSFVTAFDARGGGAYALVGERQGAEVFWHGEAKRYSIEELQSLLHGHRWLVSPDETLQSRLTIPGGTDWVEGKPLLQGVVRELQEEEVGTERVELLYLGQSACP